MITSRLRAQRSNESPSGRQLLCVLRLLFTRLYGLDPQDKVQQMTDPHHGDADPADRCIFHAKKADCHNSGDHCDDLAFCSGGHGFFLNKAVQMLFVSACTYEPIVQFLGAFCKAEQGRHVEGDSGQNGKHDPHSAQNHAKKAQYDPKCF